MVEQNKKLSKAKSQVNMTPDQLERHAQIEILRKGINKLAELSFATKLHNVYLEALYHKEMVAKDWMDYTRFYRGEQWPARRPAYKVSGVLNFMVENVERKTALLTDAKPIPQVTPISDDYQATATVLNEVMRMIFAGSDFGQATAELIENSQVFGSGFMGTVFDKAALGGLGEIRTPSFDPRAVYIDPVVLKSYLLREGEFVIFEDIWPMEKAKDIFPARADEFRPDYGLTRIQIHQPPGLFRALINRVFSRAREENVLRSEVPRVHVREYYMRDRQKDSKGNYVFKNASRKVVMVGDVIADDGENPYDDGEFPIDMLAWHTDFHSAWGWGDIELLKSPQEIQNKIVSLLVENLMLTSNAIWIGDSDAMAKEDWEKLNNAPGSYVRKKPGRELRREPGVQYPPYAQAFLEHIGITKDVISGMVDVMKGVRTGQVSSGVAIEALQLMAQALIRLRARALEALQARVGRKLISRIFQFYSVKRIMEMYKVVHSDTTEEEIALKTSLLKPIAQRGQEWTHNLLFRIEPGSSLGMAKTQRRMESIQLRTLQVIDDDALLDDLEYPNRKAVLKRTRKKREDAANAEVQGANQPTGAGTRFPNQTGGSPAGRV